MKLAVAASCCRRQRRHIKKRRQPPDKQLGPSDDDEEEEDYRPRLRVCDDDTETKRRRRRKNEEKEVQEEGCSCCRSGSLKSALPQPPLCLSWRKTLATSFRWFFFLILFVCLLEELCVVHQQQEQQLTRQMAANHNAQVASCASRSSSRSCCVRHEKLDQTRCQQEEAEEGRRTKRRRRKASKRPKQQTQKQKHFCELNVNSLFAMLAASSPPLSAPFPLGCASRGNTSDINGGSSGSGELNCSQQTAGCWLAERSQHMKKEAEATCTQTTTMKRKQNKKKKHQCETAAAAGERQTAASCWRAAVAVAQTQQQEEQEQQLLPPDSSKVFGGLLVGLLSGAADYWFHLAAAPFSGSRSRKSPLARRLVLFAEANSDANRLYEDLMMTYNRIVRPVQNNSDRVVVKLSLKLSQLIDVNLKNQMMTTNVWLTQEWEDYKLKWDPSEYGGIQDINLPAEQIWLPDIVLYNSAEGYFSVSIMTKAKVRYDGIVNWNPPAIFRSSCQIDITYFPFDSQNCHLKFGSWTFGTKIDLKHKNDTEFIERGTDLTEYYQNVEWDIMKATARRSVITYNCCPNDFYPDVTFHFKLRRKPLFYTVNLILPCVAITILSFLVFYLPSDSGEKVTLTISILVSLIFFLSVLIETIPSTSTAMPLLGKYLVFTMILIIVSVCATVCVLNIHFRTPSTHSMSPWVKRWFIEKLPRYLFMNVPQCQSQEAQVGQVLLPEQLIYLHNQAYALQQQQQQLQQQKQLQQPQNTLDASSLKMMMNENPKLARVTSSKSKLQSNELNWSSAEMAALYIKANHSAEFNKQQQQQQQQQQINHHLPPLKQLNPNLLNSSDNSHSYLAGMALENTTTHNNSPSTSLFLPYLQSEAARRLQLQRSRSSEREKSTSDDPAANNSRRENSNLTSNLSISKNMTKNLVCDNNNNNNSNYNNNNNNNNNNTYNNNNNNNNWQQQSKSKQFSASSDENNESTAVKESGRVSRAARKNKDKRVTRDIEQQQQQKGGGGHILTRLLGSFKSSSNPAKDKTSSGRQSGERRRRRRASSEGEQGFVSNTRNNNNNNTSSSNTTKTGVESSSSTSRTAGGRHYLERPVVCLEKDTSSSFENDYQYHNHFQARASVCSTNLWRVGPSRRCSVANLNYPTYYQPMLHPLSPVQQYQQQLQRLQATGAGSSPIADHHHNNHQHQLQHHHHHHHHHQQSVPKSTIGAMVQASASTLGYSGPAAAVGTLPGAGATNTSTNLALLNTASLLALAAPANSGAGAGVQVNSSSAQLRQQLNYSSVIRRSVEQHQQQQQQSLSSSPSQSQQQQQHDQQHPSGIHANQLSSASSFPSPPPPPPPPPLQELNCDSLELHHQHQQDSSNHLMQQSGQLNSSTSTKNFPQHQHTLQQANLFNQPAANLVKSQQTNNAGSTVLAGHGSSGSHLHQHLLQRQQHVLPIASPSSVHQMYALKQPTNNNNNNNDNFATHRMMMSRSKSTDHRLCQQATAPATTTYGLHNANNAHPGLWLSCNQSSSKQVPPGPNPFFYLQKQQPQPESLHHHQTHSIGRALGQAYMQRLQRQPTIYSLHSNLQHQQQQPLTAAGPTTNGAQPTGAASYLAPLNTNPNQLQRSNEWIRRSRSQNSLHHHQQQQQLHQLETAGGCFHCNTNTNLGVELEPRQQHYQSGVGASSISALHNRQVKSKHQQLRQETSNDCYNLNNNNNNWRLSTAQQVATNEAEDSFNSSSAKQLQQQQQLMTPANHQFSSLSLMKLISDVDKAIQNAMFIAQHIDNLDEFESVKENWKYIAMVIDRIFLIVFLLVCIAGTLTIFWTVLWELYNDEKPIDLQLTRQLALNLTGNESFSRSCREFKQ